MQADQHKNPWTKLSDEVKYDNNWIRVTEYQVLNPKGGPGIYGVVHFKNVAVGVIALDDLGFTYLVGQHRFPLDQFSWEIPEGGGKVGQEDTLETAKRELLEETGLVAGQWEPILEMHLSNSVSDEYAIIYLARHLQQLEPCPEDTEELHVMKISFDLAYEMVQKGEITDSMSVAAIMKLRLMQLGH